MPHPADVTVCRIAPHDPAAVRLIRESDNYLTALYPAESNHLETISALSQPNVALFGVFVAVELVVCGGVKSADDDGSYAEIKRVFVDRRYRGRGLAKLLMKQLEEHALESGLCVLRLETGVKQPEALGLYQRLGYRLRGPFGRYTNDPLSVYMEKVVQKA